MNVIVYLIITDGNGCGDEYFCREPNGDDCLTIDSDWLEYSSDKCLPFNYAIVKRSNIV